MSSCAAKVIPWKVEGECTVAESGITKKVLAYAMKDLMRQRPLSKITVGDICDACDMNRKSFYYHFRDKYDLVNWIFYTDFFEEYQQQDSALAPVDALERFCLFFQKNQAFYRSALKQTGQNSFYEYLGDVLRPLMSGRLKAYFAHDEHFDFYVDFFVNIYRDAVARWLMDGCKIEAHTFVRLLYRASAIVGQIAPAEETV